MDPSVAVAPELLAPKWFVPVMLAIWIVGAAVMARIAGWPALARQLRAGQVPAGQTFRFVSGSLGSDTFPIRYRNCMRLVVGDSGFYLALMFPFKIGSPALFVPWASLASAVPQQQRNGFEVVFQLRGQWSSIRLRGLAAQQLLVRYTQAAAGLPSPA